MTDRQSKQLVVLQTLVDERLEKLLTDEQRDQMESAEPPGGGPGSNSDEEFGRPGFGPPGGGPPPAQGRPGFGPPGGGRGPGGPLQPGEILPSFVKESLNLTTKQTRQLDALQRTVTKRLQSILTRQQQQQLMRAGPPGGRPGGRPE